MSLQSHLSSNPSKTLPADPLLVKAVSWALNRQNCLISCRTLLGVELVVIYLRSKGRRAESITAATSNEDYGRIIDAYNEGRIDFVVSTAAMIMMGGFRLKRPGHITATHYMNPEYARQLTSRMLVPPDNDHNLDIEAPECSPPL